MMGLMTPGRYSAAHRPARGVDARRATRAGQLMRFLPTSLVEFMKRLRVRSTLGWAAHTSCRDSEPWSPKWGTVECWPGS